jgi:hypothetical protein
MPEENLFPILWIWVPVEVVPEEDLSLTKWFQASSFLTLLGESAMARERQFVYFDILEPFLHVRVEEKHVCVYGGPVYKWICMKKLRVKNNPFEYYLCPSRHGTPHPPGGNFSNCGVGIVPESWRGICFIRFSPKTSNLHASSQNDRP